MAEPLRARLARRLVTVPATFVLLALAVIGLPIALPMLALLDVLGRRHFGLSRCYLAITWVLGCEAAGVTIAGLLTLRRLFGWSDDAWLEANFRLQCNWTRALLFTGMRLFGMRLVVEGDTCAAPGPVLVLVRHASVFDTLLPSALLFSAHGLRLRYVIKRELLWDPCVDIVGQRLPNGFVRRGSRDPAREIALVASLATGLGPRDGVLIYPEGTRFSARRQAQIRARYATEGPPILAQAAEQLQFVLPPRLGGVMALLDAAPDADVVICAHRGFDGARRISDFWNGKLLGQEVRVRFWRVPRAEVPVEPEARLRWLLAEWARVDTFVGGA